MIIERIQIDRFGALANVTIDALQTGVQVLHGTNETGKTSLLEFVRAVFFGFGGLFRRGVLDPHLPWGGTLVARAGVDGRRISIDRRHEGPHLDRLTRATYESQQEVPVADHLTVVETDSRTNTTLFLQDFMGEIDESTFTAVMAFGLDELHELRTLDSEGCGSRLYELASGLDRSQVARVLANLREAVERLNSSDPEVSPIESLRQRRSGALARLAAMNAPAIAAGSLGTELAEIDAGIVELEAILHRAQHFEQSIRKALPLELLFHEQRRVAEKLSALEATPPMHADLDTWLLAGKQRDRLARVSRKQKRERRRLARLLAATPADTLIWKKRAAVTALCDEQPRLERLASDAGRAESASRLAARRFGEQLGAAGVARLVAASHPSEHSIDRLGEMLLPTGFTRSFAPLKERARELAAANRDVQEARHAGAAIKGILNDTRNAISGFAAGSPAHRPGMTIAAAIEEASGLALLFRNRLSANEQLLDLDRSLTRLQKDVSLQREGQLIPFEWLLALGALFVIGAGMLLSGLLLPASVTGSLAYAMAALGLAGTGLASVATWSLDRTATGRLEASRQQYDMVQRQRGELLSQCRLLDKRIAGDHNDPERTLLDRTGVGVERLPVEATASLERRAIAAGAEVARLEEMAAREGSLHLLTDNVTIAEQTLAKAMGRRSVARSRWHKGLEQRGLPATLSPNDVRQIAHHRHSLIRLDLDRRNASEEARARSGELTSLGHRIEQLMVECEMVPESTPLEHLQQLRERLDLELTGHRRRGLLTRKLVRARQRHRVAVHREKLAERRVHEIVVRWGVDNEEDFLSLVDRRPLIDEARRAAQAAETAWLEARRSVSDLSELDRWMSEIKTTSLEQRLAEAHLSTVEATQVIARARDRRQSAAARVDAASRDHSTEGVQVEIAAIEHSLDAQCHRRHLLETARTLLEETRATVARDHQPAVLREASRWLVRLTEGRYTSITTSIHEAHLEVHDSDNKVWSPDRLSRGTREQVFLALRLALVRDLERHGVHLPVVIDDALVNFDDKRALAAARVLVEFAADQPRERQILVLTCHSHVATIFRDAGAHVRSLSEPDATWLPRTAITGVAAPGQPVGQPSKKISKKQTRIAQTATGESMPPVAKSSTGSWAAEDFFFSHAPEAQPASRTTHRRRKSE